MKILWQAYDQKDYTGGPVVNAVRLLPGLKSKGYDVHAIIGNDGSGHPNADMLTDMGIDVFNYIKPPYSYDHVPIFLNHVAAVQPDIFVSNISCQAAMAGRWIRNWGIPIIHTVRSEDDNNLGTARFFFKKKNKWNLDALVSVNNYLLDIIKQESVIDFNHSVIPSGVPMNGLDNKNIDNTKKLKIIYTGRLLQIQKRIFDLLDSFIEAAKLNPNYQFTLMGSGSQEIIDELKLRIVKNCTEGQITILGRKFGEDYKKELLKHHVIALMSDYEGIPGSLMDGMSCGLVPISLKINGIDELINHGQNGFIIENRKEGFIKILELINDNKELRNQLANASKNTIKGKFSLEYAVNEWDQLFKKLHDPNVKHKIRLPKKIILPPLNPLLVAHKIKLNKTRYWKAKNWLNRKIRRLQN